MDRRLIIAVSAVVFIVLLLIGINLKKNHPVSSTKELSTEESSKPAVVDTFDVLLKNAISLEEQGELLKAQDDLKGIMASYVSNPRIEEVQKRLENLNMKIMVSAVSVPSLTTIRKIKEGDSLSMIADEYRTTVEFIKKQNGLSSDVIRVGMHLRIWTGRLTVLVDKSQNLLTLKSSGEIVKTYRVSTGKNNITPVGTFKVITRLVNPSWTHEGKLIPAGSPENILGTRWLGFDIPSYGIHGTTEPQSIGQQATAGCVRMLNNEVEELYDLLPINTEVVVMD